jgi:hypothetical protein
MILAPNSASGDSPNSASSDIIWDHLDGGDIYAELVKKGAKLGLLGNRIIREFKAKNIFKESIGKKLGRSKEERTNQRLHFQNLKV